MIASPQQLRTIIACAVLATGTAVATPVTYQFSGRLTDIRGGGAGLSYGDNFGALFTYDDQAIPGRLLEPGRAVYSTGPLSVTAAGILLTGTPSSELQVFDNWTNTTGGYHNADGFFVSSYVYDAHGFTLLQFDLWDNPDGHKLTSIDLPTHAQLLDLAGNGRIFIRRFDDGVETGLASGYFVGMTPSAPVPEPAEALLMLAGLVTIMAYRRRAVAHWRCGADTLSSGMPPVLHRYLGGQIGQGGND